MRGQFIEDTSIIYNKNGSIVIGKVLEEHYSYILVEAFNDVLVLFYRDIDYQYKADRIGVLNDGRFHVVSGYNVAFSLGGGVGGGEAGSISELSINKKLNSKLSLGISLLGLNNFSAVSFFDGAEVREVGIFVNSSSISIGGEYFFLDNLVEPSIFRMFGHLNLGYSLASSGNEQLPSDRQNAGFVAQYGLGLQWANKKSRKYFVKLSQTHQKVDGRITSFGFGRPSFPVEYDLWMNSVLFSFGCEFNLQLKSR